MPAEATPSASGVLRGSPAAAEAKEGRSHSPAADSVACFRKRRRDEDCMSVRSRDYLAAFFMSSADSAALSSFT